MSLRCLVMVGFVALLMGCGKSSVLQKDEEKQRNENQPAQPATYQVKAEDLSAEFTKDEAAAIAKYSGALIEVSGVVVYLGLMSTEDCGVGLRRIPGQELDIGLQIAMKGRGTLGKLAKKQEVVIRCTWKQTPLWKGLVDGEVLSAGSDTAVRMKAEEFAKQFTANPKQLKKMCEDRTVILEGVVESEFTPAGPGGLDREFKLKGDGKTRILCRVHQVHINQVPTIATGKTITIVGAWRDDIEGEQVELSVIM